MELKYQDITEVVELSSTEDVNQFLKCGWVILNSVACEDKENSRIIFALGWSVSKGEVKRPPSDYPFKN